MIVIAARLWWSRRDISDRDAIEVNRACNGDAMIAIAAWWSRSRRGDRDRGEVIAISARWSWLREDDRDWGAILKSRISDPKVRIASLAIKSRSQRSYNDLSPMIMIEGRRLRSGRDSEKLSIRDFRSGLRSWRWNRDRSVIVLIAAWWFRSQRR